ncbi:hypothetical protein [Flavobacterium terrigena]|uniref:Uncharacterized protein n=1 Tax=Flavobacterium terrigena TaxID=402734 RepID=A0A1H6WX30_9FLAO|nr:hypothetical protein [Flavobacterium terrigena]SEJ21423.1 hypothetical protein SAMN05660918_2677 [Flavobacterium terrigena]
MKLIFIHQFKDFYKIVLGIILLALVAFFPVILAFVGSYFEGIVTGERVHEGNSVFMSFGWLCLVTIPVGIILLIAWLGISVYNIICFIKSRN